MAYKSLSTANLPDPVIDPAADDLPTDYFNAILYTGDGSSSRGITGVGFKPDWLWIKSRSNAYNNNVWDVVRGASERLLTNSTDAEETQTGDHKSFDSDGFTVGAGNIVNANNATYVAWNWKAGGSGVSNTNGDITSTVSANTEAGFSIVGWTHDGGTNPRQIGHGLNKAPEMIITKHRNVSGGWHTYHKDIGATKTLLLNSTDAAATNSDFGNTTPTSSVFYSSTTGVTGRKLLAYCFHSVDGFSKCGSYVGNGSTDGTFVYTGFKVAFLMTKRTDSAGGWHMFDSARGTFNPDDPYLYPHLSNAEVTSLDTYDFLSNGFKNTRAGVDQNASGGTYIYMAFAETPFRYATAR